MNRNESLATRMTEYSQLFSRIEESPVGPWITDVLFSVDHIHVTFTVHSEDEFDEFLFSLDHSGMKIDATIYFSIGGKDDMGTICIEYPVYGTLVMLFLHAPISVLENAGLKLYQKN